MGFEYRLMFLCLLTLGGCVQWDGTNSVGLRHRTRTAFTTPDGTVKLKVPLIPADQKILLTVRTLESDNTLYIQSVEDDKGDQIRNLLDDLHLVAGGPAEFMPTGAVVDTKFNVFNWPIDEGDPVVSGEYVTVVVGAVNADREGASGVQFEASVLFSEDSDLTNGELVLHVHYAGDFTQDPETVAAIELAFDELEYIYDNIGIQIVVAASNYEGESTFARPGYGTPGEWTEVSASTNSLGIDVVIVDTIAGSNGSVLGGAGSIPGALRPSEKSGVIISSMANAGPDLRYTNDEIKLLGATIAHEVGHQLGLFHPVELTWERWDALEDTQQCESESECVETIGSNLMYPTALCSLNGCMDQTALTPNQAGVMHRYTAVK